MPLVGSPDEAALVALRGGGLWRDGEPLRLHLGCGEQRFEGYVNVDYPADRHNVMTVRPDLEADLVELSFPDDSVDEIRLHHVFEHFSRVVALGLLIRWRQWLKAGGLLVIETPDFLATALAAAQTAGADRMAFVRHLEGDQAMAWAYHVGQWYPERFERTLSALGYGAIAIEETSTERWHRIGLRNVTASARKDGPRPLDELLAAADGLLWESTVADAEKPTHEIWRRQLRSFLARTETPQALAAHEPLAEGP
jgi:hypothetical protein